jgi:rubrerythrin
VDRQVLLDKLSEFLMVEQGGLQLYRVVAARAVTPELQQRYLAFGQETARHREVLTRLIQQLGGDPSYVSPTARLAQVKTEKLLETCLISDGLSVAELEANDLENVLLAETKDHADWSLLSQLTQQAQLAGDAEVRQAVEQAVAEVESEEDEHLEWARQTLAGLGLALVLEGPAPPPERWQQIISGPVPPIEAIHPAPVTKGLLQPALQPVWQEATTVRAMQSMQPKESKESKGSRGSRGSKG